MRPIPASSDRRFGVPSSAKQSSDRIGLHRVRPRRRGSRGDRRSWVPEPANRRADRVGLHRVRSRRCGPGEQGDRSGLHRVRRRGRSDRAGGRPALRCASVRWRCSEMLRSEGADRGRVRGFVSGIGEEGKWLRFVTGWADANRGRGRGKRRVLGARARLDAPSGAPFRSGTDCHNSFNGRQLQPVTPVCFGTPKEMGAWLRFVHRRDGPGSTANGLPQRFRSWCAVRCAFRCAPVC